MATAALDRTIDRRSVFARNDYLPMRLAMCRTSFALALGAFAVAGMSLADHDERGKGKPRVKALSVSDITEKIDGMKAKATTVEVTLGPGEASAPHRHPGPVFGYVLEGEYEWAIDDKPARTLKV